MTPQRLKQEAFRLKTDDSSPSGAEELIQGVYAAEHKITGSKVSQYDFRLCIASNTESMWFSSDGKVGFINGDPFELSSNERVKVRKLFGELDALVYAGKKAR